MAQSNQGKAPLRDITQQPALLDRGIRELHSSSHEELLDAIDRLRDVHIDKDINIPQIVVCGDQSSGKSSVLEAIAGVSFPVGINTVTCFATEVVLRRAPKAHIDVRLRPSTERGPIAKAHVGNFKPGFSVSGPEDFGRVILSASTYLKAYEPLRGIWDDVLRVEISGPHQMHLTLVDLPGLVHADLGNATSGDEQRIKALVSSYIRKPRTIVLAVVNALYDLNLQEVIKFVRSSVEIEERTLAIVTKPDRLEAGSDDEKAKIKLAKGGTIRTGYGWHVLRNLPHEDTDRSPEHRNDVERAFLAKSAWSQLDTQDLGIHKLREKLGQRLFGCIISELPALLGELNLELRDRRSRVERLGPARGSIEEQRRYLSTVMSRLHRLTEATLEGDYDKAEFVTFFDHSEKRLRATINERTDSFAEEIRQDGPQYHVFYGENDQHK